MSKATGESALLDLNLLDNNADDENMNKEETFIEMDHDTDQLLISEEEKNEDSVFSLSYYVRLFDVDTDEVVARLGWSILPRPHFTTNFAKTTIKAKPDLYGPFWISVTLIFSVAIAGNVASYFQMTKDSHWHYDFHKVTVSAAVVFLYVTLVPSGIFAILWSGNTSTEASAKPSFILLLCIFGYSLLPLIPASLLWLIQISMLQWALVLLCFIMSGGLLAFALWPLITESSPAKTKSYTLMAVILGLNLLLASGFMLYFYHVPSNEAASLPNTVVLAKNESLPVHNDTKREMPVKPAISSIAAGIVTSELKNDPNTPIKLKPKI